MGQYDNLIAAARQIKTETLDRANTALRVGGWMEEALRYLRGIVDGKCDAESNALVTQANGIVAAINEVAGYAGMSEERYDSILREVSQLREAIATEAGERATADAELAQTVKEYPTTSQFPESGKADRLYIASDTGAVYRWNGSAYTVMGGYSAGDGIDIDGSVISNTHTHLTSDEIDAICV